ncbi:DUF2768 domain-containing protein [Virgibacillus sp. MSP4-1]|uniref:DUF2768 domain-containing protein n=1 Tax=Virgibacillus sp. MSP4-1 TaxID=2700081 RepID=UPI0005C61623|nr:DUF2768 domain-containing protein [Virgibacillus sp. MSP4-1]QHS22594.1 DUF2768 domain-containing protein [Virgibacillus sp. MSP4-1]
MSRSMLNMYISFVGMALLLIAMGLIYISRNKLKGFFSGIVGLLAYICFIFGSIIIFYIVLSGPTA